MSEKTFKEQLQHYFKGAKITEKGGYVCAHVEGELEAEDLLPAVALGFMKLKRSGSGVTLYFQDVYAEIPEDFKTAMRQFIGKVDLGTTFKLERVKQGAEVRIEGSDKDIVALLCGALAQDKRIAAILCKALGAFVFGIKEFYNETEN